MSLQTLDCKQNQTQRWHTNDVGRTLSVSTLSVELDAKLMLQTTFLEHRAKHFRYSQSDCSQLAALAV